MFALRGLAVSFSVFAFLYAVFSVAICCLWRQVFARSRRYSSAAFADALFFWRMSPLVLATFLTLAFTVPSFLLLEPRATNETIGTGLALLGISGALVVLAGLWNSAAALAQAARTISRWSLGSRMAPISTPGFSSEVPLRVCDDAPPLTTAGILRPSVWLSKAAQSVLTAPELQSALRHEMVHVRRRDNLRKLALRLVSFPGMGELEQAWRVATEMAADDAAVANPSQALDLAAALIKLFRLVSEVPAAELTTALVHSSAQCVNARVERLLAWTQQPPPREQNSSLRIALGGLAAVATLAFSYPSLLSGIHAATELLVR